MKYLPKFNSMIKILSVCYNHRIDQEILIIIDLIDHGN